jgi:type I restriction enzyme S subunit
MEQQVILDGYKQTEVGVIPDDWEVKSFGNVLKIRHGKSQKEVEVTDGLYPIFGTGGEMGRTNTYLYNKPSVLIGRKGSINKPRFMDTPFWTVDTLFYSEVNADIDPKFVFYKFCLIDWMTHNEASGVPSLNSSTIENIVDVFPRYKKEQTDIANALSDVDALIAAIEKLIAKKQAIKTATMQQLLTGKKRLPPFDLYQEGSRKGQPKGTQPTELGEIPDDWTVETITSISAVPMQNGLFYEPSRKGQGISLINVGDMYKSAPIDVELLELFDANNAEIKTFRVSSGDLFFTRSSIVPSGIAFCNIYESEYIERDVVFDSHLIRVRVNSKMANAKYVYLACLSNLARKFLISSAKTATMTTIDQGAIKNCPVILPSLEEQILITQILSDMDFELEGIKNRLAKTQQIKQGMMQELLTGKTRLV